MRASDDMAGVAQLVRAPVCGTGGCGFDPPSLAPRFAFSYAWRSHAQMILGEAVPCEAPLAKQGLVICPHS